MKKLILCASLMLQVAVLGHSNPVFAVPGNGNANGYARQGNGNAYGHAAAPVPLAGAGLPALALIGGAYVAVRKIRNRRR